MSRPNQLRVMYSEVNLARRIAYEREQRGWSYEGIAERMTRVGCAIQASAIYKIEKGNPPRRISVDELVAVSRVLDVPVDRLLVPLEVVVSEAALMLFSKWTEAGAAVAEATEQYNAVSLILQAHMNVHPEVLPAVESAVRQWSTEKGWNADEATEHWLLNFRAHVASYKESKGAENDGKHRETT